MIPDPDEIEHAQVVKYSFQNEKNIPSMIKYGIELFVWFSLLLIVTYSLIALFSGFPEVPDVYVFPAALILIFTDIPSKPWVYEKIHLEE